MLRRRLVLCLIACVFCVLAQGAFAAPRSLNQFITNSSFTPGEQGMITEYVTHWCDELANSNQPSRARKELVKYGNPAVTSIEFRLTYSDALVPRLETLVENGSDMAALNAVIVLGQLSTDRALDGALSLLDEEDEARWIIRCQAARACERLFQERTIPQAKIKNAVRMLKAAAENENDGRVLLRQLQALSSVQGEQAETARLAMADALNTVVTRLSRDTAPPTEMLDRIAIFVPELLQQFINLRGTTDRKKFGKAVAPSLLTLLEITQKHWGEAEDNPELRKINGRVVHRCEQLLKQIDTTVRDAQTQTGLQTAWEQKDKTRFDRDLAQWTGVLNEPAYRQ
jgi:hypothetical protein